MNGKKEPSFELGTEEPSSTVLVVESDLVYGERLCMGLQRAGFFVRTATDGLEALQMVRSFVPDLIVVDQVASWVDGFRVCRLTKFNKRLQRVPVVIMATVDDEENRALSKDVTADGYFDKKTDLKTLIHTARQLVAEARSSSAEPT